jgi:large subunit ribosomal protein L25
METTLPVALVGHPRGVVEGGVLDDHHHEVTVRSLPANLPGALELDVSSLLVGDSVHVSDLTAPEGVTILDDPETVLASVLAPTVEPLEVAEEEEVTEVPETGEEASATEE